jgi:hypothetical protein
VPVCARSTATGKDSQQQAWRNLYPRLLIDGAHKDGGTHLVQHPFNPWPEGLLGPVTRQDCLHQVIGGPTRCCVQGKPDRATGHVPIAIAVPHISLSLRVCLAHSPFILRLMSEISCTHCRRSLCSRAMISSCGQ